MGGLRAFQIHFDNPIATYYGGQVVSGRIIVKLDKSKNIRGIEVRIRGQADVEWSESKTERDNEGKEHTVWETFRGHEQYFDNRMYVVGSSGGDMVLPVGEHAFPFSMTLPTDLPSSFEGSDGNVRYTVKATMDRPWKFDHEAKAAFTVIQHLDLNTEQGVKEPVQVTKEKFLCCCCCQSGPITMVATVPVTGYVPGQDIPVTIEIDNTTTESVPNVTCRLIKTVRFHAGHGFHDKTRTDESKVVTGDTAKEVGPHGSGCWTVKLIVPSLPPSYLKHCNIIDINYKLSIKGIVAGPHSNMHIEIPIVLGTIPLTSYFPHISPGSALFPLPSNTDTPPSFNEIFGDGGGMGAGGDFQANPGWNVNPAAPTPYPPGQYLPNGAPGPYPPPGGPAHYPPSAPGPYPPMGGSSPYPSEKESTGPYPPTGGGSAPYPPGAPGPYPPMGTQGPYPSPGSSATYPPGAPGPYPPTGGSAPYPPGAPAPYGGSAGPSALYGGSATPSAPFDPHSMYPEMPPPSYEESMFGKKDIKDSEDNEHIQGDMGFAPRYPMYQFNN